MELLSASYGALPKRRDAWLVVTDPLPHLFWITSRAAGFAALILASLAVCVGLLMSTKLLRRRGADLVAIHEILSLSTIAAIVVHAAALLGDNYLHPSLADITIPFVSDYKSVWTSIGIFAGWSTILLGISYYARRAIGAGRWRKLHRLTALAWLLGLAHSLGEGTDAGTLWFLAMLAVVAIPALALLASRILGVSPLGPRDSQRVTSPDSRPDASLLPAKAVPTAGVAVRSGEEPVTA